MVDRTSREPFAGPLAQDDLLDGVELADLDLSGQDGRRSRFMDCVVTRCVLDGARLDHARLVDTDLLEVRATSLDLHGCTMQDVTIGGSRVGALQAYDSELVRLTVQGGKLDDVNLRGSRLRDVRLTGCVVGTLDLSGATVDRLVLTDVRLDRLDVTGARLQAVDLRGADLRGVDGLAGLAGATVSYDQLADLAPVLAAHLGISVV